VADLRGYLDSYDTTHEAVTVECQRVLRSAQYINQQNKIIITFVFSSRIESIFLLSQLSVCSHNPTIQPTRISRFLFIFFPSNAPHFFGQHDSPSNLATEPWILPTDLVPGTYRMPKILHAWRIIGFNKDHSKLLF